jgi:hypothetical protein
MQMLAKQSRDELSQRSGILADDLPTFFRARLLARGGAGHLRRGILARSRCIRFLLIGRPDQHKTRPREGGRCTRPGLGKPQSIGAGRCLDYRMFVRAPPGFSLIWVNVGPSAPVSPKNTNATNTGHGTPPTTEAPVNPAYPKRTWAVPKPVGARQLKGYSWIFD